MWPCATAVCALVCVTSSVASTTSSISPHDAQGVQNLTTVNKSFSFLNAIRRNLRRNNDDYVIEQAANEPLETVTEIDTFTPFIGTISTVTPITNKGNRVAPTQPKSNRYDKDFRSKMRPQKQKLLINDNKFVQENNLKPLNKIHRSFRGNKWKRIIEKNNNLQQHGKHSKDITDFSTEPGLLRTSRKMRSLRNRPVERASSLHAFFSMRTQGLNRDPPDADQLDMAPARGAYIHDMRGKGRICHRHILWPEGPKYDSEGNIIMPMYRPKLYNGKDFAQTAKPLIVLPRCCNCCKKSVLGCQ